MLWKSESTSIVEAVKPKSDRASACAVMREKLSKKKRVDSCGMLVQTTEIYIYKYIEKSCQLYD